MILNSYGMYKGMVREICRTDPHNAVYLLEQTPYERQCLVVILSYWNRMAEPKPALGQLGKMLSSQSKKTLLKKYVQPYPPGLDKVLGKLGSRIWTEERYDEIIELLKEPNAAKVLRHLKKIRPFTVDVLRALPPAFRVSSIVDSIHEPEKLDTLRYAIIVVRKHVPGLSEAAMAQSLTHCKGIRDWFDHCLLKADLPKPPWQGTEKLTPLGSVTDMLRIAGEFNNDLADKVDYVIGKKSYFYVWRDDEKAVVELIHDYLAGWGVGEINGSKDKSVKMATRKNILDHFESVNIHGHFESVDLHRFYDYSDIPF